MILLRDGNVSRSPTIEQCQQFHSLLLQCFIADLISITSRQADNRHVDCRGEECGQHKHLQHVHLAPAPQLHAHTTPGLIMEVAIPNISKIAQPISIITEARVAAE